MESWLLFYVDDDNDDDVESLSMKPELGHPQIFI